MKLQAIKILIFISSLLMLVHTIPKYEFNVCRINYCAVK